MRSFLTRLLAESNKSFIFSSLVASSTASCNVWATYFCPNTPSQENSLGGISKVELNQSLFVHDFFPSELSSVSSSLFSSVSLSLSLPASFSSILVSLSFFSLSTIYKKQTSSFNNSTIFYHVCCIISCHAVYYAWTNFKIFQVHWKFCLSNFQPCA